MKGMSFMEESFLSLDHGNEKLSVSTRQRIVSDDLILFIHGLGWSKESFDGASVAPELRNYSLCTFDLIGFG